MSLAARLLNVFAIPGEVFEVVRASRVSIGNCLLPMFLLAIVGALTAIAILSQPAIQKPMREGFDQQIKALGQQVKAGKLKQADADRDMALARFIIAPLTLNLLGGAAGAAIGAARAFWWAFVLWILGRKFLKARISYVKTLEVASLALMISVLGGIVPLLLMVDLPRLFAGSGLQPVVSDFEALAKNPLFPVVLTVFAFWMVGVLSVGLARLARVPFFRAGWFVLAFWIMQDSTLALFGGMLGQFVP